MKTARLLQISFLAVAIGVTAATAFAQDVTIRPQLRAGDEFRLEVSRIREDSSRPQLNGASRTVVGVRVVSATADGCVLDWMPGETALDNPQAAQDPMVVAASGIISQMVFRLNLNADGEFTGVANQSEVAPKLQAMLDTITQSLSARLPAEERKAFQNLIGQAL